MTHTPETLKAAEEYLLTKRDTDDVYPNPLITTFLAGYDYRQKEIDELVEGLQQALRFVKSSREDYDELQELIQKHKR